MSYVLAYSSQAESRTNNSLFWQKHLQSIKDFSVLHTWSRLGVTLRLYPGQSYLHLQRTARLPRVHLFWACHTADEDTNSLPWAGEPVQSKLLAVRGGSWISGQWSPATLRKSMLKGLGSCCLLAGERHPGERVLLKDLVWGLGLPSSNRVTLGKSEGSRMHSWKGLWALFYKRPKIRNEAISFRSHSD